jgi:nitroimidazol reductase NimA-like FMN-containing flavoprotein (pyridoxamine 5'-phosphate oxidase superfamily)
MATMSRSQREEFLAGAHVGVLSVADIEPGRGPITVPIWYAYSPGPTSPS